MAQHSHIQFTILYHNAQLLMHTPPCKLKSVPPTNCFSDGVQPEEDEAQHDQKHRGHRQHQLQRQTDRPQLKTHLLIVLSQPVGTQHAQMRITGDYWRLLENT